MRDLDLELAFGESLGLVGVNGAGKTTLVTLLARMREPTGGAVTVDGVPLTRLGERAWQRQVAVVYQDFARFPFSAAENIGLFADGPPDPELLATAAERAGAADLIAELPRGWDTVLSPHYEGGVGLSGGQWQRIALARALYAVQSGARVLVLDEPTAQLDVRSEAAFYDRFLELTAGVTSIVISHRFGSVRRAHRIAVLDGGRITELGTHDELLDAGGAYAEMFHRPGGAVRVISTWRRLRRRAHRHRLSRCEMDGVRMPGHERDRGGGVGHVQHRLPRDDRRRDRARHGPDLSGGGAGGGTVHAELGARAHVRNRRLAADRQDEPRARRPDCADRGHAAARSSTSSATSCSRGSSS